MNPARTFGPDLISGNFTHYLVYVTGPIAGAVVAVGIAFVLRGRGGGSAGSGAGQGDLFTEIHALEDAHSAAHERKQNPEGERKRQP
jgi:aquaporin Z